MDLQLRDRVCVVTGGSSGIGLASAAALVAEGASVLIVGRDRDRLAAAEGRCAEGPGRIGSLSLDVTAAGAAERIVAHAEEWAGPIDGLVNGASSSATRSLEEASDEEWRAQWELDVIAPKRLMDAVAPRMAASGGGAIVNVCSSAGRRPSSRDPAYAVAKRGELALTKVYAERFGADGVRINAIAPGPTETPLWLDPDGLLDEAAAPGEERAQTLARVGAGLPLGRLASAEEVGAAIVFLLAVPRTPNGAVWSVDGGHVPDVFP